MKGWRLRDLGSLDDSMVLYADHSLSGYQDIAVSQECGGVKAQEQQQMNTAPAVRLDYKQGAKSDGFGQLVQLC